MLVLVRPALAEPRASSIGTSQGGAPLVIYSLGDGPKRVLILGGQHGGPEANTVELVSGLLDYFAVNPEEVPPGIELDILPVANPDGLADGSRQLLSGVDPNRNWGGNDWRSDAFDSNAVFRVGLGGAQPIFGQGKPAVGGWGVGEPPPLLLHHHQAGGVLFWARGG